MKVQSYGKRTYPFYNCDSVLLIPELTFDYLSILCYSRVKDNCPQMGPGPTEELRSVEVFLSDPSQHLREFQTRPRKTPNG